LNLHKKSEQPRSLSVNTGGGPAIVNVGEIYGNVQQVVGDVNHAGQPELAGLLGRLAAAINQAETLGDQRTEYLEQVGFIAKQVAANPEARQASVVKGVLLGLRAALQDVGAIAGILGLAGPTIAAYFGFQWPF
jgi:hypothetical protein